VHCEDQQEIDAYWKKLSAVPEAEQCGWVKDRYGISWQIVPSVLGEMMKDPDPSRAKHATEAMLGMKKLDIAELERAYGGQTKR
jgi:predicted 3-demethylubiquinone-9 3-methyltransferase (glyoxalase superfamily)